MSSRDRHYKKGNYDYLCFSQYTLVKGQHHYSYPSFNIVLGVHSKGQMFAVDLRVRAFSLGLMCPVAVPISKKSVP